ncbi:hypothetical protein KUTeg_022763 [Tegillarca granosa]|uniref:Uncharacterized protein n=1 Tax=Tegillarca granosa TaxID=220873 RepID=A0ABQ9DZP9_TEGGR|nr:hypothetical protein KUTeg_022763 [Tegillarca granosa]
MSFIFPFFIQELEEIYIDTSNTINAAIESHALLLLTKANEQHKRFEDLLKICRQVNPKLDISFFVNALNPDCAKIELHYHNFNKPESSGNTSENSMTNQLISDSGTEINLQNRRAKLQKEASELTSYIKQNQDITNALVNICQRNLGNHLYSKVYETQEDLCRKRNEIRMGNMKLASIRAQIELLTPKQNGSVENDDQEKSSASIKTMWKKAFKSLKTSSAENKLTKKASFIKKKQRSKEDEAEPEPKHSGDIDPVYSLLKCAADLPKAGMQEAVVNSLGSEFKNYYKLTSPLKKSASSPFDFF